MPSFDFDWVDAFTETPFGGNACVVVHARPTLPAEDRLRWSARPRSANAPTSSPRTRPISAPAIISPTREILMAGHPTIATVASLVHRGLVDLSSGRASFTLEVGAGVLPIEVEARAKAGAADHHDPAPARVRAGAGPLGESPPSTGSAPVISRTRRRSSRRARPSASRCCATTRRCAAPASTPRGWPSGATSGEAGLIEPFLVALGGRRTATPSPACCCPRRCRPRTRSPARRPAAWRPISGITA